MDSEVVAAAAGLAAMSIGRFSGRTGDQSSSDASGTGGVGRVSSGTAGQEACGNGSGSGVGCDAGVTATAADRGDDCPAAGTCDSDPTGLVVEGKAVAAPDGGSAATTAPVPAAPCAGGVLEKVEEEEEGEEHRRQQAEGAEFDDIETPLSGISRCEAHLRAAAVALKSLLVVEASLETGVDTPPVPPPPPPPRAEQRSAAAGGAGSKGADRKKETPRGGEFRLGGAAAAFAFEPEMNRHLLGSSPQHHVHFRRGRAEGPRALMHLAREAERACGVVRCEDLLGARRCLLRLFQPPAEVCCCCCCGCSYDRCCVRCPRPESCRRK